MNYKNTRRGKTPKEKAVQNDKVILNVIQDLQRLPLQFVNNLRGRSHIKYGMTTNFNQEEALNKGSFRAPLRSGFTARAVIPQCRYAEYSGRTGFTLIELLVVVLIIGILAAVAVPQYQKAVLKARMAQWDVSLNAAQQAITSYVLENGLPDTKRWFTGKNRVGNIEMPGNCDINDYACYTDAGEVAAGCEPRYCYVDMDASYHADGTQGNNYVLCNNGEDGCYIYFIYKNDQFYANDIQGDDSKGLKILCQYLQTRNIPVTDYVSEGCPSEITFTNIVEEE